MAFASLGSGNCCHVVLKDVGPPVLAVADVLNPVAPLPKYMVEAHQRICLRWFLAVFPSSKRKVATLRPRVLRWSLVWCLVRWARLPLPNVRESLQQADCLVLVPTLLARRVCQAPPPGAGVCFRDLSPVSPPYPHRGKEHMAAPNPTPGPTLGPSQVSFFECA